MATLFQNTLKKIQAKKSIPGITVIEMWEHVFDGELANKKSDARKIVEGASH